MIKAKCHTLLTDGKGHQKTLQWNGPISLKPSLKFANVFKLDAGMGDAGANYVDVTCSDITLLRRWTNDSWQRNIDGVLRARERHERGELSNSDLQLHITGAGFFLRNKRRPPGRQGTSTTCLLLRCLRVRLSAYGLSSRLREQRHVAHLPAHVPPQVRERP